MQLARGIARNKGFLIALALAAWLGLEMGGKGTGIVNWMFTPSLTRDPGRHPVDLVAPRPKGPVRLGKAETDAVQQRLVTAFGANLPKHQRTSEMQHLYQLKDGARCPADRSDAVECNKVQRMDRFLAAILEAMHPAAEHVLLLERKSYEHVRGGNQPITIAVFLGADERLRLIFDLREMRRAGGYEKLALRRFDGELRWLAAREVSNGILMADDPGDLRRPGGRPGGIQVYGGVEPSGDVVAELKMDGDVLVRQKFFSAVHGKPVAESGVGKR